MKKGLLITLVVLVIAVVIIVSSFAGTYNSLVGSDAKVKNSFSNIEVQLQRRNDLIPNLVSTVKGYAAQEEKIFTEIANARAKLAGASTINDTIEANNELSSSLSRLLVIVENYPDLKSSQSFLALSDELAGTENRITVARKDYNDDVTSFNTTIRSFPTNLLAGMFGFKEYVLFKAADGANVPPVVSFSSK